MHTELVETMSVKPSTEIVSTISDTIQSESSRDSSSTNFTSSSTINSNSSHFNGSSSNCETIKTDDNDDIKSINFEDQPNAKRIKITSVSTSKNLAIENVFSVACLNNDKMNNEISSHENLDVKFENKQECCPIENKKSVQNIKLEPNLLDKDALTTTKLEGSVLGKIIFNENVTLKNDNSENNKKSEIKKNSNNNNNNNNNNNTLYKYFKTNPILTQVISSKSSFTSSNIEKEDAIIIDDNEDKLKIVNNNENSSQENSQPTINMQQLTSTNTKSSNLNSNKNIPKKSFACLRNLGSTCYINCIIQVMRYTPGFVISIHRLNKQIDYLRSLNNKEIEFEINQNNDTIFVINLHELLVEMSDKEKLDRRPIYTPRKFVNTVWTQLTFWSDGSQQDAHEFLQYTIHFINECDLFIRKLQQKYHIKQMPLNNETYNKSINIVTSSNNSNSKSSNSNNNNNKNSNIIDLVSQANRIGTRSSARLAANTQSTATHTNSNSNSNNVNNNTSSNKKNNKRENMVKCKSSNNIIANNNNNNNNSNNINEEVQPVNDSTIRLIKSMPKIKSIEQATPTKGGASAFNVNMLDSLTNKDDNLDNNTNTNTIESSNFSNISNVCDKNNKTVLNKIEVNNHKGDYFNLQSNKESNNIVLKNNENIMIKNKEQDNQELIFRPLIKENDFNVNNNFNSNKKQPQYPIKVKFLKVPKTENYKIIDETNKNVNKITSNISPIVEEKDLVSKRLRETLQNSSSPSASTKNSIVNKIVPRKITPTSTTTANQNKKFKRDELIENLNKDLDSNSFIIIDSENEDCDVIVNNSLILNSKKQENMNIDENNKKENEEKLSLLNEEKKCIKTLNDQITNGNHNKNNNPYKLKKCFVLIKKLKNIENSCQEYGLCLNNPIDSPKKTIKQSPHKSNNKRNTRNNNRQAGNTKRLRSKSKTFPESASEIQGSNSNSNIQLESITNNQANSNLDKITTPAESINNNLDAITLVSSEKSINFNYAENIHGSINNNLNIEQNSMKSKLRSSSSNSSLNNLCNKSPTPSNFCSQFVSPVRQNSVTIPVLNTTPNANTSSALVLGSNSAPPSPAELLRKYSSSIGYVCEMDKLFQGSSVTVTQCLGCENLRKCPEAFYDRSIPVDTNYCVDDEEEYNGVDWISKCLKNESYLNENSKYMCDICSSKQEAKIHTQYTQMPNILILHLLSYGITSSVDGNLNAQKLSNRSRLVNYFDFVCSREQQQQTTKFITNDHNVSFKSPITTRKQQQQIINVQKISNDSTKSQFKLFAVVMHSGVSLNSGHYTAFVNYKIISQHENNDLESIFKTNKTDKLCSCLIDNSNPNINLNSNTNNNCNNNNNNNNNLTVSNEPLNNNNNMDNLISQTQPEWLHFDDTKVKTLSSIEFHKKIVDSSYDSPYILFYVKD